MTSATPGPAIADGPAPRLAALIQSGKLAEPPARSPRLEHLSELAADAQRRALDLLVGRRPAEDPVADIVRLLQDSPALAEGGPAEAAATAGLTLAELSRLRAAYRHGGPAGLHVALLLPVRVSDEQMQEASEQIRSSAPGPQPEPRVDHNRICDPAAGAEIRLGPDQCWHPFTVAPGGWAPASGRDSDPVAAYQAALRARRARGLRPDGHPRGNRVPGPARTPAMPSFVPLPATAASE